MAQVTVYVLRNLPCESVAVGRLDDVLGDPVAEGPVGQVVFGEGDQYVFAPGPVRGWSRSTVRR